MPKNVAIEEIVVCIFCFVNSRLICTILMYKYERNATNQTN